MKIGELAQVAQCTVETARYYEKEGLLPAPARKAGNFRVYDPAHVERLWLTALRERCGSELAVDACGMLQGLAAMDVKASPARHTHLG